MSVQTFNLSLPKELVKKLDAQAKREFSSRSDYVRKAILNQLRAEKALDEVAADKRTSLTAEYETFKAQYGKTLKNLADR